jgi:hypothetical protein
VFERQVEAREGPAEGGRADCGPLGGDEPRPQVRAGGLGLRGPLAPEELQVVCAGALAATRVRRGRTAPAAAPPLPELLDKRRADTQAWRNRAWRCGAGFQRLADLVTKVWRRGLHSRYGIGTVPYRQMQSALGAPHHVRAISLAEGTGLGGHPWVNDFPRGESQRGQ